MLSLGVDYPLWVVTHPFWVDQLMTKEGKHYPKIIYHPKRMVTTHRGQSLDTGKVIEFKNLNLFFYYTIQFVVYFGLKMI